MLKTALKIAISGALIAWLVLTTNTSDLRHALGNASPAMLVLGAAVLIALSVVQTWRWLLVAGSLGVRFDAFAAWIVVLIGTFFNQVLPSSIGGDAARIWRLQRAGVALGRALNSVVVDRLIALVGMLLIVSAGMPVLFTWTHDPAKRIGLVVLVVAIVAGLVLVMLLDRVPLPARLAVTRANRGMTQLARATRHVLLSPRRLVPPLLLALVIHFGVSFVVWLIARGSDVHVSIGQCFVLVPVVVLFSMVPVSIAGWGVREGAMVVALGLVGVARAPALAVSVLFGLTLAVSGLPGGFLWLRSAERTRVREATSSSSSLV